jgi:putative ABC transport system permease protein
MAEGIPLDVTTLAFTALLTLATGILFGLIPAWQASNPALARELAETGRSNAGHRRQLARSALVIGEVALSMVLLIGAGLTLRSFGRLLAQDAGYVPEHLLTMSLNVRTQKYPQDADRIRLFDSLLVAVRNIPGVESAGTAFGVPLTSVNSSLSVTIRDAPPPAPGEAVAAGYAQVSPGYFQSLKTPLLQGRDFTERDDTNASPVVIVDETFVKKFKLGAQVLGRRINIGDGTENAEIIGVVKDIKRLALAAAPRGEMYRPYRQSCWGFSTLIVRTQRDPSDVTRAIRAELDRLDKDLPLESVRTMSQLVAANLAQRRLSVQLLGGFAGGALLLSALGLYGVLAYLVSQRTREIGIRMALGAQRRDVLNLVIGQGLRLACWGIALGLAGAFALTHVLQRLLYEITPTDPLTFAAVTVVLALTAILACFLPAWRAAQVHPLEALRYE